MAHVPKVKRFLKTWDSSIMRVRNCLRAIVLEWFPSAILISSTLPSPRILVSCKRSIKSWGRNGNRFEPRPFKTCLVSAISECLDKRIKQSSLCSSFWSSLANRTTFDGGTPLSTSAFSHWFKNAAFGVTINVGSDGTPWTLQIYERKIAAPIPCWKERKQKC